MRDMAKRVKLDDRIVDVKRIRLLLFMGANPTKRIFRIGCQKNDRFIVKKCVEFFRNNFQLLQEMINICVVNDSNFAFDLVVNINFSFTISDADFIEACFNQSSLVLKIHDKTSKKALNLGLLKLIERGNDMAKTLIEHPFFDVHWSNGMLEYRDEFYFNPLLLAIYLNHYSIALHLLKHGYKDKQLHQFIIDKLQVKNKGELLNRLNELVFYL